MRKRIETMRYWSIKFLVLMVIIYILQVSFPFITRYFALYPPEIFQHPWTIVTAMFLHAPSDFGQHLLYNMLALGMFGMVLEAIIGSKRWLIVFLTAGILANIAGFFAYLDVFSLGASGAIMGVIGTLVILRPKLIVWFGGPLPLALAAVIWVGIDVIGFFSPTSGVGNAAHLMGMAVGITFGLRWRKQFSVEHIVKRRVSEFLSDVDVYS